MLSNPKLMNLTLRSRWVVIVVAVAVVALAVLAWRLLPTRVQLAPATRDIAVEAIYATGSVEPGVMLPIAPRVAGTIAQLLVDEGSRVRKGQVLARLEDTDLKSTVEEQAARAQYARENFDRTQDLVHRGFVSPGELDRARSDRDAAEAALRRAATQRDFTALLAPADGVVIRRDGEIGQYIGAGQALFTMSCCAPLRVSVEVDEEDILRVRVGQKVVLHADALPGATLDGEVAQVTPKGDPVSRSYRVRIRLADAAALRVGMTVDANIVVAARPDALLVPSAAVQAGTVWIVHDGRLHRQPVKIGVQGIERTEILDGLDASAQVVVSPPDNLVEGHRAVVSAAPIESAHAQGSGPAPAPVGR